MVEEGAIPLLTRSNRVFGSPTHLHSHDPSNPAQKRESDSGSGNEENHKTPPIRTSPSATLGFIEMNQGTGLVRAVLPMTQPKRTKIPTTVENTPAAAGIRLGREGSAAERLTS